MNLEKTLANGLQIKSYNIEYYINLREKTGDWP